MDIQRALLVGLYCQEEREMLATMKELGDLAEACGMETVGMVTQNLPRPTTALFVGEGKADEIEELVKELNADVVIFHTSLSPTQLRNLQRRISVRILDRTNLILEIFEKRAQTREAKLQVEEAQLQYMLPRLIGMRENLGRQSGSGGAGLSNKGSGEKKLELDRRILQKRLTHLERELREITKERTVQRSLRNRNGNQKVALVGYTNAGKSTLMNCLLSMGKNKEDKKVFEKDMLFATLETSIRMVQIPGRIPFLLSDTVGFIHDLPHHLVKAFQSTLEEALDADLLLILVDYSSAEYMQEFETTRKTLTELRAQEIPYIVVLNKADVSEYGYTVEPSFEEAVCISAKSGEGIDQLLDRMQKVWDKEYRRDTICVTYEEAGLLHQYRKIGCVLSENYTEEGICAEVILPHQEFERRAKNTNSSFNHL